MGATNFPNGISQRGTVTYSGLAAITGAGTVTTDLDTIVAVVCSPAVALGTATTQIMGCQGTAHVNATAASTFIIRTYQGPTGSAGTVATNVAYHAIGTKA